MVEKIGPIKNPLTIIAIFAAIAEISGTVVLPFIAPTNQSLYVWFLIIFPILLIVLFFLTLNFNHKVLYAPSDYQNEDNFLRSLPKATFAEKVLKIEAEIAEEETVAKDLPKPETVPATIVGATTSTTRNSAFSYQTLVRRSTQAAYMLAEDLIFQKLSKEFSTEIQREVKLNSLAGRYIFDGIVRERGVTTVIEVKYLRNALMSGTQLRDTLARIQQSVKLLPAEQTSNFRVLLALATDEGGVSHGRVAEQIDHYRKDFSFPIEIRFYNLAELEREFNVKA
ncbi:MAG: hypothetical protein WCZ86_01965 [Desulfurivibrionaceae bacterium]